MRALPHIALVVARARNGVIGRDSLPLKPLPGRLNLVLSKDESFEPKGALACLTLDEAIEIAREQAVDDGVGEVCVIGGAGLFAATLPRARRLYLTEVEAEPEGDVIFPPFDETAWTEVSCEAVPAGEKDDHAFAFRVLERR